MEISLDLGAKFDLVSKGELDDAFRDFKKDIFSQRRGQPLFMDSVASGLIGADGTLTLDLGSPATGRIWNVTGYTAFGSDDGTTVANAKVAMYFGDPDLVGLMGLVRTAANIPSSAGFGENIYWCHSTQNVIAQVSGTGTPGAQVGFRIFYADWPEAAIAAHTGK